WRADRSTRGRGQGGGRAGRGDHAEVDEVGEHGPDVVGDRRRLGGERRRDGVGGGRGAGRAGGPAPHGRRGRGGEGGGLAGAGVDEERVTDGRAGGVVRSSGDRLVGTAGGHDAVWRRRRRSAGCTRWRSRQVWCTSTSSSRASASARRRRRP